MILRINGKLGILENQKVVIPFEYEDIEIQDFGYSCLKYDEDNEENYVDVYNTDFQLINSEELRDAYYLFSQKIFVVSNKDNLDGIMNIDGKIICPCIYRVICTAGETLLFRKKDGSIFMGDKYGSKLTGDYKNIKIENLFIIVEKMSGKWALMNKKHEIIIDDQDSIKKLNDFMLLCTKDKQSNVFNNRGELIVQFPKNTDINFEYIVSFETKSNARKYFIFSYNDGAYKIAADLSNRTILFNIKCIDILNISNEFALIDKEDGIYQINLPTQEEKLLYKDCHYWSNIYDNLLLGKDNICCVIDKQGKMIIPLEYERITEANDHHEKSEDKLLIVKKDKKLGVINLQNEIVISIDKKDIEDAQDYVNDINEYDEDEDD